MAAHAVVTQRPWIGSVPNMAAVIGILSNVLDGAGLGGSDEAVVPAVARRERRRLQSVALRNAAPFPPPPPPLIKNLNTSDDGGIKGKIARAVSKGTGSLSKAILADSIEGEDYMLNTKELAIRVWRQVPCII